MTTLQVFVLYTLYCNLLLYNKMLCIRVTFFVICIVCLCLSFIACRLKTVSPKDGMRSQCVENYEVLRMFSKSVQNVLLDLLIKTCLLSEQ